jgi:serine/threonine protein kinase
MDARRTLISDDKVIVCQSRGLTRGFDDQSQRTVLFLEPNLPWRLASGQKAPRTASPEFSAIITTREGSSTVVVLEDFDGVSLQSLMERRLLSQADALVILRKLAVALDHLHACQQIHGALRPSSILIGAGQEVRIFDWMLGWKDMPLTLLSEAAEYLSPERLSNKPEAPRADQFTLGIIAYELVVGREPFPADGLAEKLFRTRYGLWDDGAIGEIELATHKVYDRVFTTHPKDRFDSCSAFVEELEKAFQQRSYTETRLVSVETEENPGYAPAFLRENTKCEEASPAQRASHVSHTFGWWAAAAAVALIAFVLGLSNWRMQSQIDELGNQAETLMGMAPASADISQNGIFTVCNSSPGAIDVSELAVAYWGQDHKLQVFNSTQYTQEGWKVSPASSQLFSWPLGQKTVWDGSVLFYFVRVRDGQKEYIVSGRWDGKAQGCLHLSS